MPLFQSYPNPKAKYLPSYDVAPLVIGRDEKKYSLILFLLLKSQYILSNKQNMTFSNTFRHFVTQVIHSKVQMT